MEKNRILTERQENEAKILNQTKDVLQNSIKAYLQNYPLGLIKDGKYKKYWPKPDFVAFPNKELPEGQNGVTLEEHDGAVFLVLVRDGKTLARMNIQNDEIKIASQEEENPLNAKYEPSDVTKNTENIAKLSKITKELGGKLSELNNNNNIFTLSDYKKASQERQGFLKEDYKDGVSETHFTKEGKILQRKIRINDQGHIKAAAYNSPFIGNDSYKNTDSLEGGEGFVDPLSNRDAMFSLAALIAQYFDNSKNETLKTSRKLAAKKEFLNYYEVKQEVAAQQRPAAQAGANPQPQAAAPADAAQDHAAAANNQTILQKLASEFAAEDGNQKLTAFEMRQEFEKSLGIRRIDDENQQDEGGANQQEGAANQRNANIDKLTAACSELSRKQGDDNIYGLAFSVENSIEKQISEIYEQSLKRLYNIINRQAVDGQADTLKKDKKLLKLLGETKIGDNQQPILTQAQIALLESDKTQQILQQIAEKIKTAISTKHDQDPNQGYKSFVECLNAAGSKILEAQKKPAPNYSMQNLGNEKINQELETALALIGGLVTDADGKKIEGKEYQEGNSSIIHFEGYDLTVKRDDDGKRKISSVKIDGVDGVEDIQSKILFLETFYKTAAKKTELEEVNGQQQQAQQVQNRPAPQKEDFNVNNPDHKKQLLQELAKLELKRLQEKYLKGKSGEVKNRFLERKYDAKDINKLRDENLLDAVKLEEKKKEISEDSLALLNSTREGIKQLPKVASSKRDDAQLIEVDNPDIKELENEIEALRQKLDSKKTDEQNLSNKIANLKSEINNKVAGEKGANSIILGPMMISLEDQKSLDQANNELAAEIAAKKEELKDKNLLLTSTREELHNLEQEILNKTKDLTELSQKDYGKIKKVEKSSSKKLESINESLSTDDLEYRSKNLANSLFAIDDLFGQQYKVAEIIRQRIIIASNALKSFAETRTNSELRTQTPIIEEMCLGALINLKPNDLKVAIFKLFYANGKKLDEDFVEQVKVLKEFYDASKEAPEENKLKKAYTEKAKNILEGFDDQEKIKEKLGFGDFKVKLGKLKSITDKALEELKNEGFGFTDKIRNDFPKLKKVFDFLVKKEENFDKDSFKAVADVLNLKEDQKNQVNDLASGQEIIFNTLKAKVELLLQGELQFGAFFDNCQRFKESVKNGQAKSSEEMEEMRQSFDAPLNALQENIKIFDIDNNKNSLTSKIDKAKTDFGEVAKNLNQIKFSDVMLLNSLKADGSFNEEALKINCPEVDLSNKEHVERALNYKMNGVIGDKIDERYDASKLQRDLEKPKPAIKASLVKPVVADNAAQQQQNQVH